MIEKEILDRVPLYPGRITLNPVEGAENTYDMVRADNPRVEGTPINKATLDSIIQSRLTGRYYPVTVTVEKAMTVSLPSPVIPKSGWTEDSTGKKATQAGYSIEVSSISAADYSVAKSVDGNENTSWSSADGQWHTWTIKFPYKISAKTLKVSFGFTDSSASWMWHLRGSNDGETWTYITDETDYGTGSFDAPITTEKDYIYFQVNVIRGAASRAYIKEIDLGGASITYYRNKLTVEGAPATWDVGQRITIQMPTLPSYVTADNTFMGIACNAILQSGRRYELVYNGTSFDAKGV